MAETQEFLPFLSLPELSREECEDAAFRGKDRAWATIAGLFDDYAAFDPELTYKSLGDRIGRSRSQVQRWIDSPHNMTLTSLALLAEGLDSDLLITLKARATYALTNQCHPAEAAAINVVMSQFKMNTAPLGSSFVSKPNLVWQSNHG